MQDSLKAYFVIKKQSPFSRRAGSVTQPDGEKKTTKKTNSFILFTWGSEGVKKISSKNKCADYKSFMASPVKNKSKRF